MASRYNNMLTGRSRLAKSALIITSIDVFPISAQICPRAERILSRDFLSLLETPLISFYRVSPITFFLGVPFVRIKNYSIVNILAGKKIIPELIQKHFTPDNIFKETKRILDSEEIRSEMLNHFQKIKCTLGEKIASKNAATQLEQLVFEINQQ